MLWTCWADWNRAESSSFVHEIIVKLEGCILVIIKGEIKLVVLNLFCGVYYGIPSELFWQSFIENNMHAFVETDQLATSWPIKKSFPSFISCPLASDRMFLPFYWQPSNSINTAEVTEIYTTNIIQNLFYMLVYFTYLFKKQSTSLNCFQKAYHCL